MKKFLIGLLLLPFLLLTGCEKERVPSLLLIPTTVSVSEKASEVVLEVVSDEAWRISLPSYDYWYNISPLSGRGNGKVTIKIKENRDVVKRSEQIIFTFISEKAELSLEQRAADVPSNYAAQEVRIHTKARSGKAANLLFLGDGFIESDFSPGGAFDRAVDEAVKGWFEVEPYKSYREYFNVYKMCAVSAEQGVSHTSRGIVRNTAFGVRYTGRQGESGMSVDEGAVEEYIQLFSGVSDVRNLDDLEVIVIVNDERYGGTTTLWSKGPSIALCPMNREPKLPGGFVNLVVHEAGGHGFGHLADEYTNHQGMITNETKEEMLKFQKYGLYQNVDVTPDKTKVLWSDFIGLSGYHEVSTFEGGFYYTQGVWRSEYISCMDINCLYFNVASRRAIVQRIKEMAGESFSMEEFLLKDVQRTYPFRYANLLTKQVMQTGGFVRLAPPVVRIAN